jgi:rubrerythrin
MSERTYLDENGSRSLTSRRGFLSGSAKLLGGGALALGLGAAPAFAKGNNDDDEDKKQGGKRNNGGVSDVDILNFALTLEHLEAVFYTQGLKKFDAGDFRNYFKKNNRPYRKQGIKELEGEKVREDFEVIRDHEQIHVKTLQSVLGKKAVPRCTYNFEETAFKSVGNFVSVARVLENTGVSAYDGSIAYIDAAKLQTAGATIATVEARHAAYLNLINGVQPFPEPFDEPVAPRVICGKVDPFIVRCPEPYGPYKSLAALCSRLPNKVITL